MGDLDMGGHANRRHVASTLLALCITTALTGVSAQAQETATVESTGVGDIVVTAQRREENLQDVPISVTAISNDTLQAVGVGGTTTISQIVPSVQVTSSGPSNIFFMRGVGNTSGNVGEEGANAFYVDGVYLGDLTSAGTKFNNIQRIEVLKGPQGTLFGRNSSGGLVNIITREPDNEATVQGKVGYGNYNTVQGQLYAATPLSENVSIDVALTGKDQNDGFGTNLATGKDIGKGWYWGARSKLVWRPGDATKIVLSGDYYKDYNDYVNGFYLTKGSVGTGGYRFPGEYNLNTLDNGYADIQTFGGSLTIEHEFDFATLTSITARRGVKVQSSFDADYTSSRLVIAYVPSRVNTFQQELRLASATTTPFNWQLGVFYYHAKANVDGFTLRGLAFGGLNNGTSTRAEMKTNSYAAFGEAGYDITPTTHLIAGLRYTKDERTYQGTVTTIQTGVVTVAPPAQKLSTGKVTYRVALRQDLTDKINVYASYNRGFKSGIFAATGSPLDPAVGPQTIDAFEVGLKSQLFDNMVRLNLAGFHYQIDDYQIRAQPSPGRTLLLNAATVKVDGLEGELTIAPAEGLTLNFSGTYLNSRFTDFPGAQFTYQSPAVCTTGQPAGRARPAGQSTGPATGGGINCFGDATGNKTPLSPTFASTVSLNWRKNLGNDAEVIFNALWNHSSRIFFEADNRLSQGAYDVVNLSFELRPNKNWGIELWGNNMFDERYYQTGVGGTTGDHSEYAPPRTYGVSLKFDF
ncbi:TonB-dependent receptor [Novosphingobium sp. JCM 18896]|nr:TonB-dependent receptor [Novosphingobium sp. JCM 18896]